MGLTSKKVLLLAAVLAVLLFALTVWLWPRLARRSAPAVLGRVGVLLATQLSLIAALGLAANYSFGFYASWADLLGQENQPGVVVDHHTRPNGTQLKVTGTQRVAVTGGGAPTIGGKIEKVQVEGVRSRIAAPAYVYLPPEYFQPRYKTRAFPVAVVLTGYPGTAEALIKGLKFPERAHGIAKAGRMQPTILVMMRPTLAPPRDTECMDVPGGPQTETFFTQDLRKAMSGHYRIGDKARSWGIMGDSTGGYCALKLAMRHPESYSAAASLSGYYKAPIDSTTGDLFGGDPQLARENDLMWRLDHLPAPPVSLLVTSSRHGEKNYRSTMDFMKKVKSPTTISSVILDSGGHNFNTWSREVPATLTWMGAHLHSR
ncbi:alpha/beta hydrolase [Streptomyces sp. H27-D2]|uniref:alpha/beta hydrolase n=1 Tax=Streptomyces sp. H27-D2 TaxID=3046304 RepID=UPI002DB66938|nr:alpha/beta hydrolase-fold protein [Streptomyces sp. H27-D2]MEC4016894.1 alpha/beta hydrolase-fold protein [Streptomyces sp. H27-D2]